MAADIGFIAHAAKRNARVFAPHCLGNRAGNRRFADAGRADKAEHLPLDLGRKRLDGKELKNALFYLFQAVVVAVEHPFCLGKIDLIPCFLVPGQLEHGFQVCTDDAGLGRHAAHFFQAVNLFVKPFGSFFGQLQRVNPLTVGGALGDDILFPKLGLNDFNLFPQVIFPLILVKLGFQLVLDVVFDAEDFGLVAEQPNHHR